MTARHRLVLLAFAALVATTAAIVDRAFTQRGSSEVLTATRG